MTRPIIALDDRNQTDFSPHIDTRQSIIALFNSRSDCSDRNQTDLSNLVFTSDQYATANHIDCFFQFEQFELNRAHINCFFGLNNPNSYRLCFGRSFPVSLK